MADTTLETRWQQRLESAFLEEGRDGLVLAVRARLGAMVAIGLWVAVTEIYPPAYYTLAVIALFGLLGVAQLAVSRAGFYTSWVKYAFVLLDVVLLTVIIVSPNPLDIYDWPRPLAYRLDNFIYFFVLMVGSVLSYSPGLVLWFGIASGVAWGLGVAWVAALPASLTWADIPLTPWPTLEDELAFFLQAEFVDVHNRLKESLTAVVVASLLAVAVWRARRIVRRQAHAERERGNLARYFSPNMVDDLAQSDEPLGAVRSQPVVVLFADMVGFTRLCETMAPAAVIDLLREFHRRMAQSVFDHNGTVDKFIGDAIMATFGTPRTGAQDASDALDCSRAMTETMGAWNRQRLESGLPPVRVGIGLHYGPAVLGDIGSERRLEYAVLGDTVNVASRLEGLTRGLEVDIVISDDLALRVREEGGGDALADFVQGEPQQLRNRAAPLAILTWRAPIAARQVREGPEDA